MTKCAFVGLGVMGYPMAGHLAVGGHEVTVYNRTSARAEAWVGEHEGSAAPTPAQAAAGAEMVFVCVGNDDDVRSVTAASGGALESMAAGSVLVDHTTASARLAQELHVNMYRFYLTLGVNIVVRGKKITSVDDPLFEHLAEDRFMIGTPEHCAGEVEKYARETGIRNIMCRMVFPQAPREDISRSIELFGKRVVPNFRS